MKRLTLKDVKGLDPRYAAFIVQYCKDYNARRAATATGFNPDHGYRILERPEVAAVIEQITLNALEACHIDAEWVLMEAVDNHIIARQAGNLSASNTALNMIAKHAAVDAFAAEKVEIQSDKEIMERLLRARKRRHQGANMPDDKDDAEEISFL